MKLSLCTLHVFGHVLTPGSPTTLYGYRRGKGTKGEAGEASARAAPLEEQGQPSPISEAALPLFHWLRIDRPARPTAADVRPRRLDIAVSPSFSGTGGYTVPR
jgi:hypothetical protein